MLSLENSLKLENHTSQDTILYKLNRGLFANCYSTIHDGLNVLKHIIHAHIRTHIHTHTHTHTQDRSFALRRKFNSRKSRNFIRGRSQQRLRYLYCIHINLPVSSNNRELFGVLAFSWVWQSIWCSRMVNGNLRLLRSLRDVTGEPLSWLVVSLWREDALRKFVQSSYGFRC